MFSGKTNNRSPCIIPLLFATVEGKPSPREKQHFFAFSRLVEVISSILAAFQQHYLIVSRYIEQTFGDFLGSA